MISTLEVVYVTIANGASLSNAASTDSRSLVGVIMPAAWTAASLTFQAGGWPPSGAAFGNVQNATVEVVYVADASQYIAIDPLYFLGAPQVKVRSGTGASPVNQGAERVLGLVFRTVA